MQDILQQKPPGDFEEDAFNSSPVGYITQLRATVRSWVKREFRAWALPLLESESEVSLEFLGFTTCWLIESIRAGIIAQKREKWSHSKG